jgi:phosphoserine phosphatase
VDVPQALQEMVRSEVTRTKNQFAVFDFDNTCILNDIGEATLAYLCRNKLLKDFSLLSNSLHNNIDKGEYHERVFNRYHDLNEKGAIKEAYALNAQMFSGFTTEEATATTHAAIEFEGSEIGKAELYGRTIARGLALNPRTTSLLDFVKTTGSDVWIVSASVEIAVRAAMQHFGIEAKLIGVRPIVVNGKFNKELQLPLSILEGKVECVRTYINATASPLLAVDDSMTGIALLETANIKVVIDRGNALAKEARERGWFIL